MPKLEHNYWVQTWTHKKDQECQIVEIVTCEERERVPAETANRASPYDLKVQPHGQIDEPKSGGRAEHWVQVHIRVLNNLSVEEQHLQEQVKNPDSRD